MKRTALTVDVYWRDPDPEDPDGGLEEHTCVEFMQRSHVYVLDMEDGKSEYLPIDMIERVVVYPVEEK